VIARQVDSYSEKAAKIRALAEARKVADYFHSVMLFDDLRARIDQAVSDLENGALRHDAFPCIGDCFSY